MLLAMHAMWWRHSPISIAKGVNDASLFATYAFHNCLCLSMMDNLENALGGVRPKIRHVSLSISRHYGDSSQEYEVCI